MGQVITRIQDVQDLATLTLAARKGYVRNSAGTAWTVTTLADLDNASLQTFAGAIVLPSNGLTVGTNQLVVSGGNVGIGTTSPATKLHATKSSSGFSWTPNARTAAIFEGSPLGVWLELIAPAGATQSELIFANSTVETAGRIRYEHDTNSLSFYTNNNRRATIDANGNTVLGFAATSPASLLDLFGSATQTWSANSSTSTKRTQATQAASFIVNTDASYTSRIIHSVYDAGGAREFMRADASGTAPMIGFLGASASARTAITGSRGSNAALASLLTELATKGLITDSTTA